MAFGPGAEKYQWQKNGANLVDGGNLSGSATASLTITALSDSDAANYSVIISNTYGSVTSSVATLMVNDSLIFVMQPMSQTVSGGTNVTFEAAAYGASPMVFQWYYNDSPVGSPTFGTNTSSYSLTNVQASQSGNYSVQVINGNGSLMSSNAVLTVIVLPPSIVTQPTSQTALLGNSVSFSVSLTGTPPFNYQWRFNGENITGATNAVYAIASVATNNSGNYSVVVTNSADSVTSSNALLTVIFPPTLEMQLLAGYPFLRLTGMLSNNYNVQYTSYLHSNNWINLLSITNLPASPFEFIDPAGSGQPARFYRAVMQ
jgi:hypothetical protein